ncbi:FERRY endosomal RAB5 effector complex subunit 3-like [Watersipora subatra]|uniref:FERRY endosomal RAB5 effector complex subunit 3-like n=1 Tax=Watersipora subatra TaxID=2589382 RepID=UPI00355B852F
MTVFEYEFSCKGQCSRLEVDVPIPLSTTTDDFCERLSIAHQLPCFVLPTLKAAFTEFVVAAERKFQSDRARRAVEGLRKGLTDRQEICNRWSQAFHKQVKAYSIESQAVDTSFSALYKKLIHSPSLTSILNVEHAFAMAVQEVIRDRDRTLAELERRQRVEMDEVLSGGIGSRPFTDTQISNLAQLHIERLEFQTNHWEEELAKTKRDQKIQYLDWLRSIDEDPQKSAMKARSLSQTASNAYEEGERHVERPDERLEESFTIHLGAQLKTTHNLRLLSAHILDLCRHTANFVSGQVVAEPQRLQTALSLYSQKLCGMVLLVDDRLNSYSGIKKEFAEVCAQSTDFHFPDLPKQLEQIETEVLRHNETKPRSLPGDTSSVKSGSSESSVDSQEKKSRPSIGTFYVTKHSNLSEVHAVFHLVTDETLLLGDINSRHPVILGLRNVLKTCFKHGIVNLTIPLLLTLEMTEEMTIPWCLKRAELIFKCVKGFMMEMSTWAESESRTIQFIVPKGLSVDTFQMLSNMLPGIFRQSNPIVGR